MHFVNLLYKPAYTRTFATSQNKPYKQSKSRQKNRTSQKQKSAKAVHSSAWHWKPWDISRNTANNVDMDIHILTNETVSKKPCECEVSGTLRPRQTSFTHHPFPGGRSNNVVTASFLWRNRYIAMCLQHMGPPLTYVLCSSVTKARPLSFSLDWT